MVVQQPMMFAICSLARADRHLSAEEAGEAHPHGHASAKCYPTARSCKTMRETAQGIRVVKAFTLEPAMSGRMNEAVRAVERVGNKINAVNARVNPLVDTLGGFAVAGGHSLCRLAKPDLWRDAGRILLLHHRAADGL